jgi:acyl-CoA ligase (AMP-forming) (exosortase A-associated)
MEPDPTPYPIDHVHLRGAADSAALVDRDGTWTFAELEDAVASVAGWLATQGLSPGDRVASWLPKTRTACLLPLAAARAGLVHVPVNPLLRRAQVAHILADSGARLLVTQSPRAATLEVRDVPDGCRVVEEAELPSASGPLRRGPSSADPSALAAILYTSGSTGRPKGVMLSHANLWLGAVSVAHYLKLSPVDRVLGVLPLSFDYGQNQLFSTWYAGASVAPLDYLVAKDVVRAVERSGATTLAGVPPLWVQLLEADWPAETAARLRRLTNSGGALTPRLVRGLRERFPAADLYAMYGLTEAFRSTYLEPALIDDHPDAIGRAIPFAEVMAVRPDGARAAPDEPGELVHAGPLVAGGYWRDAERTAQRFRPAPAWSRYRGTAVWSGDTVVEGADGLFRFVGRDDEMIKSTGNRISPAEVEEAVLAGGEATEAVAVGVPDERLGQSVVVMLAGDAAREQDLRARLRRELPSFMQPVRYEWRAELPRNANGKLDRAGVRALLVPPWNGEGDQPKAGGGAVATDDAVRDGTRVASAPPPPAQGGRRSPSPFRGGTR